MTALRQSISRLQLPHPKPLHPKLASFRQPPSQPPPAIPSPGLSYQWESVLPGTLRAAGLASPSTIPPCPRRVASCEPANRREAGLRPGDMLKLNRFPFMDFLKGLNAQQREAVSHIDGPLLVLAGAGSDKTRVITHRIAHIVTTRHVPPSAVLAVTFTNKAAREMRERVVALLEDVPLDSAPNLSTFHSFCVRMLRRDGDPLVRIRPGFTRRFSIYDDEDQLVIVKAAYRTLGLEEKEFMQYRAAISKISHAKNTKVTAADLYKSAVNKETEAIAAIFEQYEKALHNANALDFDDLLLEAVRLLQHDDATRAWRHRRHSYGRLDEDQATNRTEDDPMREEDARDEQ